MIILRLELFALAWLHQFGDKSAVAQSVFSPKELDGKKQDNLLDMLSEKNIDWDIDYSDHAKEGRTIIQELQEIDGTPRNKWVIADFMNWSAGGLDILYAYMDRFTT